MNMVPGDTERDKTMVIILFNLCRALLPPELGESIQRERGGEMG
jgi:hypothetical protein